MKTKCRIEVRVLDIMQPNFYQFSISESVQCLSAPEPCSPASVITGGVALPLLYFLIFLTATGNEPSATSNEPPATCYEPSAKINEPSAKINEPPAMSYLLTTINY